MTASLHSFVFFFFNDTATTEIYTLSLHDALPIYRENLDQHRWPRKGQANRHYRSRPKRPPTQISYRGRSPRPFWIRLQIDRKSTRLNSSHVRISYAVFCLKKKKKQAALYLLPSRG